MCVCTCVIYTTRVKGTHTHTCTHTQIPKKRFAYLQRSSMSPQKSPIYLQKSPPQKSSIPTQKSPIYLKNSPTCPQISPVYLQNSPTFPQKSPINPNISTHVRDFEVTKNCYCGSSFDIRKTALHTSKIALHIRKIALHTRKKTIHFCKRALSIITRARPFHLKKSPTDPNVSAYTHYKCLRPLSCYRSLSLYTHKTALHTCKRAL